MVWLVRRRFLPAWGTGCDVEAGCSCWVEMVAERGSSKLEGCTRLWLRRVSRLFRRACGGSRTLLPAAAAPTEAESKKSVRISLLRRTKFGSLPGKKKGAGRRRLTACASHRIDRSLLARRRLTLLSTHADGHDQLAVQRVDLVLSQYAVQSRDEMGQVAKFARARRAKAAVL